MSLYKLDGKCCIDPPPPVFSPDVAELGVTRAAVCFIACGDSAARSSPLSPQLSGFSALLYWFAFHRLSFGCMFSRVIESKNWHLCACLQINAQDIQYQEQLGQGNGGTVYK